MTPELTPLTRPEVTMPSRSHKPKSPPRPPRVDTAEKLVIALWLNPTEEGLREARRSLVRRLWRNRKLKDPEAPKRAERLRALYAQVIRMQQDREWEITPAERASRQRNRGNPSQYARELLQRQGTSALLSTSGAQDPFTVDEAQQQQHRATTSPPATLHRPDPTQQSAPTLADILRPTHRRKRAENLRTTAVHHLARVLYAAQTRGWTSLNLTTTYGRPSSPPTPSSTGGVRYSAYCPFDGVVVSIDTIITSTAYAAAFARLPVLQQMDIQDYYQRRPAHHDTAPSLEEWTYRGTAQAFDALLDILFNMHALK